MDKHSKRSSSLLHYPVLVVFSLFFIGLFALDLITPDRAYSEMENTTLSQRPALTQLSAKGLNSYFTAYTKYVKDQVFGRDEWISLQSVVETTLLQKEQNGGILLGREEQAEQVFSAQETAVQPILSQEPTGKSCAFFSLTTNNLATVRKGNSLATMNLPLEDFYAGAKDADVLIYNSAIEGMIASVSQLTERFPLLNEFKAVQNGQVWCTTQSLFQQSMELADLIVDMNRVFTEGTPAAGTLKFLTHVD